MDNGAYEPKNLKRLRKYYYRFGETYKMWAVNIKNVVWLHLIMFNSSEFESPTLRKLIDVSINNFAR